MPLPSRTSTGREDARPWRSLTLVMAVCLALGGGCLAVTALLTAQTEREQLAKVEVEAGLAADYVREQQLGLRDVVVAWAGRGETVELGTASRGGRLSAAERRRADVLVAALRQARPGLGAAFLVDAQGLALANDPVFEEAIGRSFADREWFRAVTATGAPHTTSAYRSILPGRPWFVAASAPVRDRQGELVGVVVATYPLTELQAYVDEYASDHDGRLAVVDAAGQVLAASGRPARNEALARDTVADQLAGGARRLRQARLDTAAVAPQDLLSAAAAAPEIGWTVVASRSSSEALAGTGPTVLLVRACTAAVVVVFVLVWAAWWRVAGRRRAALAVAERRFRSVVAASPAGIVTLGLDQRIVHANGAFAGMVGEAEQELVGRYAFEYFHSDSPSPDRGAVEDLVHGRRAGLSTQRLLRQPDGSPLAVQFDWSLIADASGGAVELLCVVTDVSRQAAVHAELERAKERAEVLWARSPVGVVEGTPDGTITAVNEAMARMLGYAPDELVGTPASALAAPDSVHAIERDVVGLVSGRTYTTERRYLAADGRAVPVHVSTAVLHDETGAVSRLAGFVVDMTEVHEQRRALEDAVTDLTAAQREALEATAFFTAVLTATPDPTFVTEVASGRVRYCSPGKTLLGLSSEQLGAMSSDAALALVHPDDRERVAALARRAAALPDGGLVQLRYRALAADGAWQWLSRRTTPLRRDPATGHVLEVVDVLRDVTAVVEAEERLTFAALHDPLTGLPNRSLLMTRLQDALGRAARSGTDLAVLCCDLDGFKRVNDSSGHAAGDAVLVAVAERLSAALRPHDTVARVGGDEFVLLVEPWRREGGREPLDVRELATGLAERLATAVRDPIVVAGVPHVVSASVGITYAGAVSVSADQVLQDADAAMYRAKQRGKDRFEVFAPDLRADRARRGQVERALRHALHRGAGHGVPAPRGATLSAVYQPVVEVASGALVGFEALARLCDDDGAAITPDEFIPVAEETGLVRGLGAQMLDDACRQLATWRAEVPALGAITMAVNVSALQASHADLGDEVRRALTTHGLAGRDLVLELTETALLQAGDATLRVLHGLRSDGVGIAIDDFGTGYASLRYLATLPVSAVKVDRSFTSGLPHDEVSSKIVLAVSGLAADLGLDCVVEGVETVEQRRALPAGVLVQGWLTGRPAAPHDLDVLRLVLAARPVAS